MKLESGNIYEIPLANSWGYGYCRYINVSNLIGRAFGSHMIEVFDFCSENPFRDIDYFKSVDLLFGSVFLNGTPRIKGDNKWIYLGNIYREIELPEFKTNNKIPFFHDDESLIFPWFVVNYKNNTKIEKEYFKIKHLEYPNMLSDLQIRSRIVMEILRKQGKNVLDYFDIEKEGDAVRFAYYLMKNIPIYSEIPKEIRGKSLP